MNCPQQDAADTVGRMIDDCPGWVEVAFWDEYGPTGEVYRIIVPDPPGDA